MTMRDGRVDVFDSGGGVINTVTIDTDRHGKFRRGCKGALFKGRSLPGSYPQIAGAAPLREHHHAAAFRCSRQPPRRAQQHLLMAAGCQKCFCVTFAESNKGRC